LDNQWLQGINILPNGKKTFAGKQHILSLHSGVYHSQCGWAAYHNARVNTGLPRCKHCEKAVGAAIRK